MTDYENKEIREITDFEDYQKLQAEIALTDYNLVDVAFIMDDEEIEKAAVALVSVYDTTPYRELQDELVRKAAKQIGWLQFNME